MSRKTLRRAASKEALKQMQLLSSSNLKQNELTSTETLELLSDDEVGAVDMPPKKKYRLTPKKASDGNERDIIVLKPVESSSQVLQLDAWPEELSEAQLEKHRQNESQIKELDLQVQQLITKYNAEIIYESESCSLYDLDVNLPPLALPSDSTSNAPSMATGSNQSQNAYQLVMDPRLGLIVGTMTPAANTTMAPVLPKLQNTTATKPRATRRRGRNSVQLAPPPPPPPVKIQKINQSVKHKEPAMVGGLHSEPTTIPKVTTPVVDLTADEIRPMADSREVSFNKLQGKTFPSLVVVARPHLRVKDVNGGDRISLNSKVKAVLMHPPTKFTEWLIQKGLVRSEQNCVNHPLSKLKLGMYSDVTKFPYSGGYVWISECCPHRFVSVFSGSLFEASPHPPSVILKLIYHWSCQTNVQNVMQWVKVDKLYVKGMCTWLRAICSVALHTHIPPFGGHRKRVEVGVISLGTTSQDGYQKQVKVEVLGILETDTKLIRLRAIEPLADGDRNYKKRFSKILEPLTHWVRPDSVLITDLTVDKTTLHHMGFAHVRQSTSIDQNYNNNTIMDYLRKIVPRMFQNTLSLLSRQIIQQFLDELVWREWFGTTTVECFDNLLIHLSEQTRANTGQSLISRLNKVAVNPFKNWTLSQPAQSSTIITKPTSSTVESTTFSVPSSGKRTSGRQKKVVAITDTSIQSVESQLKQPRTVSPDIPEQMVPLENYYYGTIEGENNAGPKPNWSLKCSMCKTWFTNNIKLMKHLFSHAHSVSGGLQQCRYCLSSVGSHEGLVKHITTSHPKETKLNDGFICVICETRFLNSFSLGKHLSKAHVPSELPYQCGTCSFRCSSHRMTIDHFYEVHEGGTSIQCPFCLKSTTVFTNGRIMTQNLSFFMQHLQKHQKKAMAKKCPKCSLWFVHRDTLKDHLVNMHNSQRRKPGIKHWPALKNGLLVPKSKQDRQAWEEPEKEINLSNLKIVAVHNKLPCKECKNNIHSAQHYQSLASCSNRNCQFSTCCKIAMHLHQKICLNLNNSLPMHPLEKDMYCVCGYRDHDGNSLAKHLAECERKSAYPTADEARKAIKTHSMLDVLGLVRRPEEPSTPTTQVVVEEAPIGNAKPIKNNEVIDNSAEVIKKETYDANVVDEEVNDEVETVILDPPTETSENLEETSTVVDDLNCSAQEPCTNVDEPLEMEVNEDQVNETPINNTEAESDADKN